MKPFSQACENNKSPILEVLSKELEAGQRVLEIGSGTGQHAHWFIPRLPGIHWQCSDRAENLPGISAWLAELNDVTIAEPVELDVNWPGWPVDDVDAVFSANTTHIMHWPEVEAMFAGLGRYLRRPGVLLLYGPFRENGEHNAPSNAAFEAWLQEQDPGRAIRDLVDLDCLAAAQGFARTARHAMPANNQVIVWRR